MRSYRSPGSSARNSVTNLLTINGEFTASVVVARRREATAGGLRWKIRLDTGLNPDITIAVRMDRTNTATLDYYLLPQFEMRRKTSLARWSVLKSVSRIQVD